ncbi:hypothetical protein BI036_gp265 [Morganella phage vB_MmoM_MP1]|uniref:Uncharacterized protein n=1 Tax=Morganella phage vB_MmoM_MP1 TaxID=1852628 RepID=A0A192YAK6_9CAUD|nr:hypothetical protein BI036_gp265 [Morganella phage vB_MmoM_MP1]ANM46567.1 hypothetical protein MP1_gp0129 [Morganella phage vB_MmoM_MP1]
MEAKSLLLESEKLTQFAKNIFGDIVNKVYYHDDIFDDNRIEYIKEDMPRYLKIIENESDDDSLCVDSTEIVIEFINGKCVIVNTSEWGSISVFKKVGSSMVE